VEATCLTVSQYSASGVDTKLCTVADRDVSKGWNISFTSSICRRRLLYRVRIQANQLRPVVLRIKSESKQLLYNSLSS
jgi:hypothetical protein